MKRLVIFCLALILFSINTQVAAQGETSVQMGENFSLEGALDIFKNSTSLEEFETELNTADSNVNNLDLNGDDEVDYIKVEEYKEGNVHVIVLQALISARESQDVAVIEIEKTGEESATLQIVGDEDLYGTDYLIEPFNEVATSDGRGGPSADYRISRAIVNVWFWPPVRNIYRPNYIVYRSPIIWRQYPRSWQIRRPMTWNVYNGRRLRYNQNCRRVTTHRIVNARRIYTPNRRRATVVTNRAVNRSNNRATVRTNNRTNSRSSNGSNVRSTKRSSKNNGAKRNNNARGGKKKGNKKQRNN